MRQNLIAALAGLMLAACATTPPPAGDGATTNTTTTVEAVAPPVAALPPPVTPPLLKPLAMPPFPPAELAELETLPTPKVDLWDRIAEGYAIPDLVDDPLVAKWEQYYASRPEYMARSVERSRRYLYHIVSTISARKMPLDLALLPMVESAYNPVALSTSRASGIWQFVPSTGKNFGLEQNFWFDSRRDIVAATDSALDYLAKLHDMFDDWQLALAAYNWGEGSVGRAIAKNRAKGLPTDYASLPMPAETRNYVPKLQALKNIVADPAKYGVVLADIPDAPYFTVVKTTRRMDVKRAAELAEMPLDEFAMLNPQHNRPVIAGADQYTILLPIDRAEVFAAKLELTDQPLVSWQAYRLKTGETLTQVSQRYGMSEETLRAINGIGSRTKVPAGHALLVPAERPSEATAQSLSSTVFTTVPQGRTVYHTVRRGDTMASIAARYGVSTQDVRQWNTLTQNQVRVGQHLRIVSERSAVAARPRGRGTRAAVVAPARPGKPAGAAAVPAKAAPAPQGAAAARKGKPAATKAKPAAKKKPAPAPAKKAAP